MVEIKGKTAEQVWKKLLEHVILEGLEFTDRKGRVCKEAMNVVTVIENPENVSKPMEILNGFQKWVYPPIDEIKDSILGKKDAQGYYYHYGARAFDFNGINQIDDYVIPLLKKTPTTKRAITVFYDPNKDTLPIKKETPGMVMVNFNIRNKKLHTTIVIRSNDIFYGWPANVIQAYCLADYIGKELNVEVGTISTVSISAHIFEDQIEDIKKVVKR